MTRRGAILLELLLAVVLFAMAGLAIHGALDRALDRSVSTSERLRAADLAWSALSLIETGAFQPETLDGPIDGVSPLWFGPDPGAAVSVDEVGPWSGWELHVETEPSRFRGHTLVSVGVVRVSGSSERLWYTARQLVRVGGSPLASSVVNGGDG